MARTRPETGSTVDGFVIGELIHRGGMASLWDVRRAGDDTPLLMKIPVLQHQPLIASWRGSTPFINKPD